MLITKKRRRPPDYTEQLRRHPLPIDPYLYPPGGIGDLAGATGITALDAVIAESRTRLDVAVLALQATAVLSGISAAAALYLLVRDRRRDGTW